MATKTRSKHKIQCLHDEESIELRSQDGLHKCRLEVLGLDKLWDFFTNAEQTLFNKICSVESGSSQTLTVAEMEQFKAATERAEKAKAKQVEVSIPQPEVNGHAEVEIVKVQSQQRPESYTNHYKRVEATTSKRYLMLQYDIPTPYTPADLAAAQARGIALLPKATAPNPSGRLWLHGFRMTDSVWCVPSGQVPRIQDIFDSWERLNSECVASCPKNKHLPRRHLITYFIIPYDQAGQAELRKLCQIRLADEVADLHASLIERVARADQALQNALAKNPINKEARKHHSHRDGAIKRAIKDASASLDSAIQCAILFDEVDNLEELFNGLRRAISAENQALMTSFDVR